MKKIELQEIKSDIVKFVDDTTEKVKELSISEFKTIVEQSGLDIVQVGMSENIPIVKLVDYSKILFDKKKKEKEQAKKQRENRVEIKEIRITPGIAEHDMEIKAKSIDKFLRDGSRVALRVTYRGREMRHVSSGIQLLNKLLSFVTEPYEVFKGAVIENNKVNMMITTRKRG